MNANEITFDSLPQAVAYLVDEVAAIKLLVENHQTPPPKKRVPMGIDDACQIIGKAKPTIYALVRNRLLPCYKNGKKLYFFEDELLEWIAKGKKKTLLEINAEVESDYKRQSKGIRR
jgi:excisionase family DNA binding protein